MDQSYSRHELTARLYGTGLFASEQEILAFMEHEGSSPSSQKPTIGFFLSYSNQIHTFTTYIFIFHFIIIIQYLKTWREETTRKT
jgi:hypothetical protein